MGTALALALAVFAVTHLRLLAGIWRRRGWGSALLGLVLPPLAPWWGWQEEMRAPAVVWAAAFLAYAVGVFVA